MEKRTPIRVRSKRPVLITGGAGFIGANLANRLLAEGERVVIYDNLSRAGVEKNCDWLRSCHGSELVVEVADVRDYETLCKHIRNAAAVFHLAAQVAVTTSVERPRLDFEVNALGTMNVLEAMRGMSEPPPLVFTSTNKVYGSLEEVALREKDGRYEPSDVSIRGRGIGEAARLNFYSPYGCSKGAADQYVLDHARMFNLPALVFRMSCIYGPHQFGTEDQGWVAHFLIRAMEEQPIILYGDGRQVRDILFVEDLVDALLLARANARALAGEAFNIGGGPANTTSLLELMRLISELHGVAPEARRGEWRPGDQRYYVSDYTKFQKATGWEPRIGARQGVCKLYEWLQGASEEKQLTVEAA